MKYYLVYASHDGQTRKIIARIACTLEDKGHEVALLPLHSGKEAFPQDIDQSRIIIGAPIRYGFHLRCASRFINRNLETLNKAQAAFFSVNLTARKPNKNTPQTNGYLRKFLERSKFLPKRSAVFAGALKYPTYKPWDRMMIQFIMHISKGPTDPTQAIEFTDWDAVKSFSEELSDWETPIEPKTNPLALFEETRISCKPL